MKKLVFLLVILFFINSFGQESSTFKEMKADEKMSDYFSDNELKDLAKIVDFFDSEIRLDKNKPKDEAYFEFNKNIIEECINEIKGFKLPLNYKLQEEVYSKIDTAFFKEIWVHRTFYKGLGMEKPILGKAYDLNLFGKYMLFLKSLKNEDVLFSNFYKIFNISNDISFATQASAFNQFEVKEFKGIKRRFFFAIYYLTINDKIHNNISR
ncbi:hypothetical protein [Polaribacter sp. Asnod1-A03]|uniref:hypothetical protein n=1 Tax=Polaribacter sp. Asnod1-A03 TaxID=3160581 RepID=UPI00386A4F9B